MSAFRKLAVLALALAAIGLPVNSLSSCAALGAILLIVFTGQVTASTRRWLAAAVFAAFALAVHLFLPAPRIEEGHNVFLIDGPGSALEKGLPREAYRAMADRFDAAYPAGRRCASGEVYCWRPTAIPKQQFAFAADGIFDGHVYSRRVTGIDFHNAIWLRLGVVNDLSLDILGKDGIERVKRDRRSLAIFGRWQVRLPYFVMYQFPAAFAGSDLCWRGEVLWEGASEQFERIDHRDWACRAVQAADTGKRIFGFSIEPGAALAMSLKTTFSVNARGWLELAASIVGVVGVLWFLVARWRPRRAVFPLLCAGLALVVVVLTDVTFLGGYRPFDAGDDGLMFAGFGRVALHALTTGDLMGVLRGAEDVYGFTAGMRYFRFAEFLLFGDSYLGYLLLMLALPLVAYRLCARFLGTDWALAFTLIFLATPLGVLFGTSYLHYVTSAARGYADPLAVMAFLAGLIALAGRPDQFFDDRISRAFFGALLMAAAVVLRPNLVLGAAVLLAGVGLAALWREQIAWLAALCLGFVPVLFPLWHNWYFGGRIVLFSDILTNANIYMVPPVTYLNALSELARLDLAGENLGKIAAQLLLFLSGPSGLAVMVPLHIAAIAILVRVTCARRYEPMLRLTALATLALIPPAFVYLIVVRYHLALWLLTAIVSAAWLQHEGFTLIDRRWPNLRERLARNAVVAWTALALAHIKHGAELDETGPARA